MRSSAGKDSTEGSWCEEGAEWMGRVLEGWQGEKRTAGFGGAGEMEDDSRV